MPLLSHRTSNDLFQAQSLDHDYINSTSILIYVIYVQFRLYIRVHVHFHHTSIIHWARDAFFRLRYNLISRLHRNALPRDRGLGRTATVFAEPNTESLTVARGQCITRSTASRRKRHVTKAAVFSAVATAVLLCRHK
jgi:hypothetical protein